jgi:hypothetical protein
MQEVTVQFKLGLEGKELSKHVLQIDSSMIGGAGGLYGTQHILQLGRHFDHYYVRQKSFGIGKAIGIYSQAPQCKPCFKTHSSDIVGQIGECLGALIMRRLVGLSTLAIEPLVVQQNRKTPDFRVYLTSNQLSRIGIIPDDDISVSQFPDEWPLETKSRPQNKKTASTFYEALTQLANYWLLRGPQEENVIGYGFIAIVYDKLSRVDMHVVLPKQPDRIKELIETVHSMEYSEELVKDFQDKFKKKTAEVQSYLLHC